MAFIQGNRLSSKVGLNLTESLFFTAISRVRDEAPPLIRGGLAGVRGWWGIPPLRAELDQLRVQSDELFTRLLFEQGAGDHEVLNL
jgi:hypothetical protein